MTSNFDLIKKTSVGRWKNKDGTWSDPQEFEYLADPSKSEKKTPQPKSVVSHKKNKKNPIKLLFSWIDKILSRQRYTIYSSKGYTFRLDTFTGETWYCHNSSNDLLASVTRPRWEKMQEPRLGDKPLRYEVAHN